MFNFYSGLPHVHNKQSSKAKYYRETIGLISHEFGVVQRFWLYLNRWSMDQKVMEECMSPERVNGGRREKRKTWEGGGGGRLLHSHFCGSPSSWVGVLWTPSLRMSRSEKASQASWLPPSPLALCPWQSWRERENKHTFHFTSKVHQYIHEQSMNNPWTTSPSRRC